MPLVSEFVERLDPDEAKARVVHYCCIMCDTLQDRKLEQGFKAGQKERVEALLEAALELLTSPSSMFGTEEDFSGMHKELEGVLTPILMGVYQAADAGEVPEAATPEAPSHEAAESDGVPEAATPGFFSAAD